jgi:hypothetical protein
MSDPIATQRRGAFALIPARVVRADTPTPTLWSKTRKARSALIDLLHLFVFAVGAALFFWSLK